MTKPIERSVFIPDVHIPFEDPQAVNVALQITESVNPAFIALLGDVIDFYEVSSFDRDPNQVLKLQDTLDRAGEFFSRLRKIAPKAKVIYCEGNHEHRWQKYLWKNPEIANLKTMQIEELLGLRKHRISWVPQSQTYLHRGFVVTHGTAVRKYSGASAQAEFVKYGCSGISGHTHRMSSFYHRTLAGSFAWFECGHLASMKPSYVVGPANWAQGLGVGTFSEKRFQIDLVPIIEGTALFEGQRFSV